MVNFLINIYSLALRAHQQEHNAQSGRDEFHLESFDKKHFRHNKNDSDAFQKIRKAYVEIKEPTKDHADLRTQRNSYIH